MSTSTQASVADMFEAPASAIDTRKIKEMAEIIAIEGDAIAAEERAISARKANLGQVKADLAEYLMASGMESVKLDNGLTPKAKVTRKFYKASGVSDGQLFEWLTEHDLGDIIRPYVHFQTLQGAMKSFDGEVPDTIINVTDRPDISLYGKSKFLASKDRAETPAA